MQSICYMYQIATSGGSGISQMGATACYFDHIPPKTALKDIGPRGKRPLWMAKRK